MQRSLVGGPPWSVVGGRKVDMVIVGVLGSVKRENRERIWPLLKGDDIVTEESST